MMRRANLVTKPSKTAGIARGAIRKITLERTFRASLEDVWDLWTTKEGLESWWGPEGFVTSVRKLDLRPGGAFEYAMTATEPAQIAALEAMDFPLTSVAHGTYTEVTPHRRLAYMTVADFIPGIAPYEVAAVIEFHDSSKGVRMLVTEDAMHDKRWTEMSRMGMSSSLDKLARLLESRRRGKKGR
jgi:uncharacterized protein YndB with AHSA1/START domain